MQILFVWADARAADAVGSLSPPLRGEGWGEGQTSSPERECGSVLQPSPRKRGEGMCRACHVIAGASRYYVVDTTSVGVGVAAKAADALLRRETRHFVSVYL
jgi:hypothetical protein